MNETIKLGLILLLITAIAGGVLSVSNSFTGPIIAEMERQESLGAFRDIFPDADDFLELDEALLEEIKEENKYVTEVYEVIEADQVVSYAIKTISGGYGGNITAITGISNEGSVSGVKIVTHSETPGIGTRIEEEEFTNSFLDRSTEDKIVATGSPEGANEVLAISGVTVSVDAVLVGVNGARQAYIDFLSN